ncbi:homocysteine biosynthesis protein [Pseudanabaena sp. FACHB-2040]|uniref:homocysteine biosynthesis protein n=1 Tax=Pseudanabaena sp. FACHB-2040 TaxID=2692859 RepID=UPI00168240F5|nr:homocysteine biosynthesis protein [Pseudanabaena sp. FACHB-2040]MBD2258853.1 homocysteine biosynthesis protein [Pseudanabaena sp. FACHB-2040]
MRTLDEINDKIRQRRVVVDTAEAFKARVAETGLDQAAKAVDVVTTGTFEPMESSGAILNLGHTDPPIKIRECYLDGVLAYAGFGAVDLYLGASQPTAVQRTGESADSEEVRERGGGHVIADLVAGKSVQLRAIGQATDCYPRSSFETSITRDTINQFYLFNPRNLYQNFIVGVNGGDRPLLTYLGPLQPRLGNAVYSNPGALSPLLNDPDLQAIGIGSRIFLGGGTGYIAWEGTQHFPLQKRLPNRTPIGPAATLALIGDAKQMQERWVRGCYFKGYGSSLMLGVGVPIPLLNLDIASGCAVEDKDLVAPIVDFSIPRRVRPTFGLVSYAQLKSGQITVDGRPVRTAPLASIFLGRQVAEALKQQIEAGQFELSQPVAPLPCDRTFLPQDVWSAQMGLS